MTDCTDIITNRNQTRYSFRSIDLITNPVYNEINIFELRQQKNFLYTYIKVRLFRKGLFSSTKVASLLLVFAITETP